MKFMVIAFSAKKAHVANLVDMLTRFQTEGRYHACDMSQFYFNVCPSGLIMIEYASPALGRTLVDLGWEVREQIWRDVKMPTYHTFE